MPRAIKNLDISLGLATIPVQLFTATSSQGAAFQLLHAKCGSRIQMRGECLIHGIVPRGETVRRIRDLQRRVRALRAGRMSLGRKELAKASSTKTAQESEPAKRSTQRRRAS